MGLSVAVGSLARLIGRDDQGAKALRRDFKKINEVLREEGLPEHVEPEQLGPLDNRAALVGFSYSWIHYLRRIQAHLWSDKKWAPTPVDQEGLDEDNAAREVIYMCDNKLHLTCHSDSEGYYLPIDFPMALIDFSDKGRIPGGILGSSVRLKAELIALAPKLGIRLRKGQLGPKMVDELNREPKKGSPFGIERAVWLVLYEASRLSIEHGTAIQFT